MCSFLETEEQRGSSQRPLWLLLIKTHHTGKVISILVLLRQYDLQQDRTTNQDARIPPVVIEQGHHSLSSVGVGLFQLDGPNTCWRMSAREGRGRTQKDQLDTDADSISPHDAY